MNRIVLVAEIDDIEIRTTHAPLGGGLIDVRVRSRLTQPHLTGSLQAPTLSGRISDSTLRGHLG